ncbi:heparinase II/III-family protein [Halomonas sp.]|uniref:heparinase II/III family protein n=1 Tax=Halomonas sp. TaxID=1486246 RepID=UPI000C955A65|nr:heparinase II/III-family protein [Halomonas sp.]MAR72946.1 heparinase [Halomonas sp.]|tara:strand:- start:97 stop:2289 length:2193 start_codon:yes stop_codon:yes gene_type:complete
MLTLTRHHDFQVFPSPTSDNPPCTNPPAFSWPMADSTRPCDVELVAVGAAQPERWRGVRSPLLLDESLPSGEYRWRVIDAEGEASAWMAFSLSGDEVNYLPPTPAELFATCQGLDQWILYLDQDLGLVRESSQKDIQRLKATAEVALSNDLPVYPDHYRHGRERYKRLAIHQMREWVDRDLMVLALLYRLEGDESLGLAGVERLLTLAQWSTDGPASLLRPCRWGDEVGLSLARNVFIAYHWLRPLLSDGERDFARSLLIRVAEQTHLRLRQDDFTQFPGHSHTSRLPAYLGIAALVLHKEHDEQCCEQWLQTALDIYQGVLPFHGDADGGWAEGPFYASSYTKWHHPFFLAVERLTDFSFYHHPFYRHFIDYCRDFVLPDNDLHPFGDGFWCRPDGKEWPGFFAQNPLRVYAERFGSATDIARCRELEQRIGIYSLHLLDVMPTRHQLALASRRDSAAQDTRPPRHRFYRRAGHGIARAGQRELRYRCSPFGNSSHRHADQGNIAFTDNGVSILCPTGSYGYAFGSGHHRDWTRTTQAHNLPLIEGQGQLLDDVEAAATVIATCLAPGVFAVAMDLSDAYASELKVIRCVLLLDDHGLVIIDRIEAPSAVAVSWRLHSNGECRDDAEGVRISHHDIDDYHCRLESDDVRPSLAHGYDLQAPEEAQIIQSDASRNVTHINWELPPASTQTVVGSCLSAPVAIAREGGRITLTSETLRVAFDPHRYTLVSL